MRIAGAYVLARGKTKNSPVVIITGGKKKVKLHYMYTRIHNIDTEYTGKYQNDSKIHINNATDIITQQIQKVPKCSLHACINNTSTCRTS